jgi:hypothetical protein
LPADVDGLRAAAAFRRLYGFTAPYGGLRGGLDAVEEAAG